MAILQEPVVGSWYLNQTGKLMKVRMLLHTEQRLSRVMIEYLDSSVKIVDIDAWNFLDLNVRRQAADG
ncbi:hypothetical protein [Sulfuriflexus mobilis]|uniref:hypothetical protein n=1 Tax=Sulfuriflexus mobilis TaxID=1811807 RepID=UPI000F81FEF9|nr:hypothetical protein [Sulfuriflexus mobilis]